jgi:hypothetical protein
MIQILLAFLIFGLAMKFESFFVIAAATGAANACVFAYVYQQNCAIGGDTLSA